MMDRQGLVITEVLTDYAKKVIQDHYFKREELRLPNNGAAGNESQSEMKDTSILKTNLNYTDYAMAQS